MTASTDPRLDPAAVCTLPPAALDARLAWIAREILPHAIAAERLESGWRITLEGGRELDAKLEGLVEAERRCCAGIGFTLRRHAWRRILDVSGVDPEAAIFGDLAARLAGAPAPSAARRLVTSLGLGTLAALVVCCGLPLAAVAIFGASAAFLTRLDAPVPIALGALAVAAAAWLALGRQASRTRTPCCEGPRA